MDKSKHKFEFSKLIVAVTIIIIYPSIVLLSWRVLQLAELAIQLSFSGALPYLTALITPAWAAFATIVAFYFNKAKTENKEKIKVSSDALKRDC